MSRQLACATFAVGLFVGGLASAAAATSTFSAPTDYFAEAIAQTSGLGIPSDWDFISPVPGVTTGQIAGPIAAITNPVTAIYTGPGGSNCAGCALISAGNASASADRSNGTLHAAGGPTDMPAGVGFVGVGDAEFGDTLHFVNHDAGPTTTTTISFSVSLDGVLGDFLPGYCCTNSGNSRVSLLFAVGDPSGVNGTGYPIEFNPTVDNIISTGSDQFSLYGEPGTVDETFNSQFSFIGPSADAGIYMFLEAGGQYQYSNFGQTASFSFDSLPAGVSFTSASGNFLTSSAVPEPSTWALMVLGFAGLGLVRYWRAKRDRTALA
jgi:hypothetical protein